VKDKLLDESGHNTMKTLLLLSITFVLVFAGVAGTTNSTVQTSAPLLERSFDKLDLKKFVHNLQQLTPPKPDESSQALLVRYFKEHNVVVEKPGAVFLDEKGSRLLVWATKAQLDEVEALFRKIQLRVDSR
jgi:hypothetical protein